MPKSDSIQSELNGLQTQHTSKSRDLDNLNKQMQDISARVARGQAEVIDLQGRMTKKTEELQQAKTDEANELKKQAAAALQQADKLAA